MAIQTTQRELLNYDIFPRPKKESVMIFRQQFGGQYHDALLALADSVNGRDCPTPDEIARQASKSSNISTSRSRSSYSGGSYNNDAEGLIADIMCRQRAQSSSVYLSINKLPGHLFWDDYQYETLETALQDCWYTQLAYWVIEDMVKTAGRMNGNSGNVFDSPVKRIINIQFTSEELEERNNPLPSYVKEKSDWLTRSFTERVSDETLDILHFKTSLVVDSRHVLEFINELCSGNQHEFRGYDGNGPVRTYMHNQITVLEADAVSFERKTGEHEKYRYGESPIVRLDLTCEYQFYKEGYEQIKPESVKKDLADD